ncbi:unnamed protein product, partial [Cylicostephanus goldi]
MQRSNLLYDRCTRPTVLPLRLLVPLTYFPSNSPRRNLLACKRREPIKLNREVLGFAVNRLQYALLAEAWRLVGEDILSPEDVDKVMSAGLGPRYAIHGPLQTVHLNANATVLSVTPSLPGIRDYFVRYGDGIRRVMADM